MATGYHVSADSANKVWTPTRIVVSDQCIIERTQGRTDEEAKANAVLCAAAPRLLRALQELVAVADLEPHRTHPVMPCDTPLARKAIADARAAIACAIEENETTTCN